MCHLKLYQFLSRLAFSTVLVSALILSSRSRLWPISLSSCFDSTLSWWSFFCEKKKWIKIHVQTLIYPEGLSLCTKTGDKTIIKPSSPASYNRKKQVT